MSNQLKQYSDEKEGQKDFYEAFLPRIDNSLSMDDILSDYSDGVLKGNILEFKLVINDLNAALFQTIKYLSSMRVKGKPIPSNIVLVSLNSYVAYLYKSNDYLAFIERQYSGGASKDNVGFVCNNYNAKYQYSKSVDAEKLIKELRTQNYTKIHIDETCIVGWATSYYRDFPNAPKSSFIGDRKGSVKIIGEIRKPEKYKDYIYPYEKEDNKSFRYLMDRLNDNLQKKNLGAFYTHPLYAKKSLELLREAINRVPKGYDYVIIDRCAGTGNLELGMTEEELSHTIVSTLEYYEYRVLMQNFGDKVRHIIPPAETENTYYNGSVRGADALSRGYIENEIIQSYIRNPRCTIILFENPPYADTTSIEHQKLKKSKSSGVWKNSFVVQEMKKEVKGTATNDIGNAFIWSAFKYYLRQPTDSYVVYSPVKYWKAQHLINKRFINGFAFNRRHFHVNQDACIMCALWSNENVEDCEIIEIDGFDIKKDQVFLEKKLPVKKIHKNYSQYYFDKRTFKEDKKEGILCEKNGKEKHTTNSIRIKPVINPNILGYMAVYSSGFDNPDNMASLLIAGRYDGNGFFLRKDNYLEKLPMFAASRYITYNREWTERSRIMKSADGEVDYFKDVKSGKLDQWLLKCLLFCVLEPQNHMRTILKASDGRNYINQLCFDNANGETIASKDIKKLKLNDAEKKIIEQWNKVLDDAKKTKNYNKKINYGLYQIKDELNTTHKDDRGRTVVDYPSLNGNIKTLAAMHQEYYKKEIVPVLFKYQFLK